tara:strand:- start:3632 stop:4348 length:717 start_codon:yes stop_codon:yes gene_type:complete
MEKEIGWCVLDPTKKNITIPPEKLDIKELGFDGDIKYCPAFHNSLKNIFIVRASFDCNLLCDSQGNFAFDAPFANAETQGYISANDSERNSENRPLVQILQDNVWSTDVADTWIETLPPFLHFHEVDWISDVRYVLGSFDIHAWPRPVNVVFEMMHPDKPILIKKGQPIGYAKFTNRKNYNIKYKFKNLNGMPNEELYRIRHNNAMVPGQFKRGYLKWAEIFDKAKNIRKHIKFMKGR